MKWLITGGAGFIGCNAAARLMADGHDVTVLDDLSRPGSADNLAWLRSLGLWSVVWGDVREPGLVADAVANYRPDVVLHLAAQVAVTTSIVKPRCDLSTNVLGMVNVLEAVRHKAPEAVVIFASTNKVYGPHVGSTPVGETQPIDPHTPYGVSKAAADLYCQDYARTYGLKTVVFRQSCCYGERQTGSEDQGWVGWFARAAMTGQPVTVFGDGYQARDLLHVEDLIDAYRCAAETRAAWGQVYNIGGGAKNTATLWNVLAELGLQGYHSHILRACERPGDQRHYVSDTAKAWRDLGWMPRIGVVEGIDRLVDWLRHQRSGEAMAQTCHAAALSGLSTP